MKTQRQSIRAFSDENVLSAWREQLTKAARNPKLKQQLVYRERELLPRFTAHYQKLRTLPRRVRRSLQRKWKQSLAGVALLMVLGQVPALAATIDVSETCTLIRAINSANNDAGIGGCTAGSGEDKIVLPADSTQTLTAAVNDATFGPTGLPVIRSEMTINGRGSTIRRASSAPDFRILAVVNTGNLTLQRTTLTGGSLPGEYIGKHGGGLVNYGMLTVTDSTISRNFAVDNGGGVYNAGTLMVDNSTISGNVTAFNGGGVNNIGTFRLTSSTISDNRGSDQGGGLDNLGTAFLTNSTISGNRAYNGGPGGGIVNQGNLTITNCTISGNTGVSFGGGGVANAGVLTLTRTLVSGNTLRDPAQRGAAQEIGDRGTIMANNFNLFGHRELTTAQAIGGFTPGARDITATAGGTTPTTLGAILNTTLANNRGPTQTHILVAGSPAIDGVRNSSCPPPNTDQRGVTRPQNGDNDNLARCDIGAVEVVLAGGRVATINGTRASESIKGTARADVIAGLGGSDVITGLGGNDVISGGAGNDTIVGARGADRLFGNTNRDRLDGGTGRDTCDGGANSDTAINCETVKNVP